MQYKQMGIDDDQDLSTNSMVDDSHYLKDIGSAHFCHMNWEIFHSSWFHEYNEGRFLQLVLLDYCMSVRLDYMQP